MELDRVGSFTSLKAAQTSHHQAEMVRQVEYSVHVCYLPQLAGFYSSYRTFGI